MTIRSVCALSLSKARDLSPRRDALLISILGSVEAMDSKRPRMGGWRSVLSMEFEDTSEESVLAKPGDWALNPTPEDDARLLGAHRGRLPALKDAQSIVEFIQRHHDSDESLDLIVHCYAGASRSVMVAAKTAEWLKLPEEEALSQRLTYANKRLGRLLEFARHEISADSVLSSRRSSPRGP